MLRFGMLFATAAVMLQHSSCFHLATAPLALRPMQQSAFTALSGKPMVGWNRRSAANKPSTLLAIAQEKTELEEEMEMIKAKLTEIFRQYDKDRDGYLTLEEYNQWCVDSKRPYRQLTTDYRYRAFCKQLKSDANRGISMEGLIYLYGKPEQRGKINWLLAGNGIALAGALLILLSIPYYLPSCTEYCRTFP